MKWKSILVSLGSILLLALGTAAYFLMARQQFTECCTTDVIFLFMGITRQGFSLPFEQFGLLLAFFLLGLNTLLISCFLSVFKPAFARQHFKTLTLLSVSMILSYQILYLRSYAGWSAFVLLLLLFIYDYFRKEPLPFHRSFFPDRIKSSAAVRLMSLLFITALPFFYKFPLHKFNQLIFQDDYPKYLYFAKYHLNILKHGALFGWNDQFSGGFPSFLDLRLLSLPFLPFSLFGDNAGFHLMMATFYITLPLLMYALTRQINRDPTVAYVSALICGFAQMVFFGDLLEWGMLPSIISIWLMLVSMIFMERFYQGKPFSLFFLGLSLGLTFYIHFISLATTISLLFLRAIAQPFLFKQKAGFKKLFFMSILLVFIVLPFLVPMLQYNRFIVPSSNFFDQDNRGELIFHFSDMLQHYLILPVWLLDTTHFRSLWMMLPLALLLFFQDERAKKNALYFFIILAIAMAGPFFNTQFAARIKFTAPIFIALFAGVWIVGSSGKVSLSRFLTVLLVCSFMLKAEYFTKPVRHIARFSDFKPQLTQAIARAKGERVLLETTANMSPYKNLFQEHVESGYPHFEGSLALQTGRNFLSHYGTDPYPFYIFREGLIAAGVYNGDDIAKVPVDEIIRVLNKWGVQSVAVFSAPSKDYFHQASTFFDLTFKGEGFEMFTLKKSGPVDERIHIQTLNPFHKQITLDGFRHGEPVTLKTNYFPAWKAFYGRKAINIFDDNGQLSFLSPAAGHAKIDLYFPRGYPLLILSGSAVLIFFILSRKRSL